MMVGSHVLIGASSWMAVAPMLGGTINAAGLVCAAAGALLPDIDHPKSWVGRRLWLISLPLGTLLGHRGVTHSLFAVLLAVMVCHAEKANCHWLAPVVVGYLSHLGADLISGGVPLFWPLRRTVSLPLCRTGSWSEFAATAILLALLLQNRALQF